MNPPSRSYTLMSGISFVPHDQPAVMRMAIPLTRWYSPGPLPLLADPPERLTGVVDDPECRCGGIPEHRRAVRRGARYR